MCRSKDVFLWKFGENIHSLSCDDHSVLELCWPAEIQNARLYRVWLAQTQNKNRVPGFLHYFSKWCNFANLGSKCYLLSSAETAVHLSFSILYSTDPSITMGSTNQQTFVTSYTGSLIGLAVTAFWLTADSFIAYIWKGNSPIVKAIPSSMVISLSLAEKQREFWQKCERLFHTKKY